jgi:protein translocase SecG subunit
MYAFITILITIVCILLGAVVLIQNPKGGGLSGSFGGVGQQLLGARRSTDIIDKKAIGKKDEAPKSEIEKNVANQPFTGGNNGGFGGQGAQPAQQPQPAGQPKQ